MGSFVKSGGLGRDFSRRDPLQSTSGIVRDVEGKESGQPASSEEHHPDSAELPPIPPLRREGEDIYGRGLWESDRE